MWGAIFSFLGGPLISGLISAYKARLQSLDSQDQRALELAQAEIQAEISARAEATKLLIAEQGRWYTAMIRPLFALPFIIFAFKVVVWDKVLGLGVTDKLDPNMWSVFQTVVVSYFGATAVERVTRIFRRG
ncbi:hypothetical protein ACVSQ4_27830 [Klebsiella pneumoniae]